jgi:tRNA-specific 2-thiouridylase
MVGKSGNSERSMDGKIRAVGLLSGGLDSALAHKVLLDQGIEVVAYHVRTPFTASLKKGKGSVRLIEQLAEELGAHLEVEHLVDEYIQMIRCPRHGYGGTINPCIDCKILFLKKAKELMQSVGGQFVFTGEVLGQRPMSQTRQSLALIENESGLTGYLLRPLSAQLLSVSVPEEKGWVDRNRLLGLQGRSRKAQIALAREYGITRYGAPAGGCLLTDPGFTVRLRDLFAHDVFDVNSIVLLQVGRHFRLGEKTKLVVGRDEEENRIIAQLVGERDVLLEAENVGSPLCLLRGEESKEHIHLAAGICKRYSDARDRETAKVRVWEAGGAEIEVLESVSPSRESIEAALI